jgi:hypothetical protein
METIQRGHCIIRLNEQNVIFFVFVVLGIESRASLKIDKPYLQALCLGVQEFY